MRRPIRFVLPLVGALAAVILWLASHPDAPPAAPPSPRAETLNESTENQGAAPAKPAAMQDATTYAAARLREIKADPEPWKDPWKWRQEFSAADSPELRREVVGLARQVGPDSFLAILAQALASDDPLVRLDAARSIALLPDASLARGLAVGVASPDAETRDEVMDLISQVQPHLRPALLREAIAAADSGVQQRAIELLTDQPSPEFFTILLEGLRTTTGDTRISVENAITTLTGEHLRDYDTATRWWSTHRPAFDSMMHRTE